MKEINSWVVGKYSLACVPSKRDITHTCMSKFACLKRCRHDIHFTCKYSPCFLQDECSWAKQYTTFISNFVTSKSTHISVCDVVLGQYCIHASCLKVAQAYNQVTVIMWAFPGTPVAHCLDFWLSWIFNFGYQVAFLSWKSHRMIYIPGMYFLSYNFATLKYLSFCIFVGL